MTESIRAPRLGSTSAQIRLWDDRFILCFDQCFSPSQPVLIGLARYRLSFSSRMTDSSFALVNAFDRINLPIVALCLPLAITPSSEVQFGSSTCPFRSFWWGLSIGDLLSAFYSIFHSVKANLYIFMLKLARAKCECQHNGSTSADKVCLLSFFCRWLPFSSMSASSLWIVFSDEP
jgi:hypothetical protein